MRLDEQLRQAMHAAGDSVEPPVGDLVEGGIARGRRQRRRRMVAGGAVTTATVLAGGVLAFPDVVPDPARSAFGGIGDALATARGVVTDQPRLSDNEVLDTLEALLPPGDVSVEYSMLNPTGGVVDWGIVFDDGDGASFMFGTAGVSAVVRDLECPTVTNGGKCDIQTLEDGSQLMQMTGPYYPQFDREPERLAWSVQLHRPDGFIFYLTEINAPTEKSSEITRSEPPLSVRELTAIATSDRWSSLISDELRDHVIERTRELNEADEPSKGADGAAGAAQDEDLARGKALAADLGTAWAASSEEGFEGAAVPTAEHAAGLPDEYERAVAHRQVYGGNGETFIGDEACAGGVEKAVEVGPCTEATSSHGDAVVVRWARSVHDDPQADYPGRPVQDSVTAMHPRNDGSVVSVRLWVSEPVEASTPERRAAAVAWLKQQVDDLIGAATVGGLDTEVWTE